MSLHVPAGVCIPVASASPIHVQHVLKHCGAHKYIHMHILIVLWLLVSCTLMGRNQSHLVPLNSLYISYSSTTLNESSTNTLSKLHLDNSSRVNVGSLHWSPVPVWHGWRQETNNNLLGLMITMIEGFCDISRSPIHAMWFAPPTWSDQVHLNSTRLLNLLRSMYGCSKLALERAYKAIVCPHLEFCGPVWSFHTGKDITCLEKVQKSCDRERWLDLVLNVFGTRSLWAKPSTYRPDSTLGSSAKTQLTSNLSSDLAVSNFLVTQPTIRNDMTHQSQCH